MSIYKWYEMLLPPSLRFRRAGYRIDRHFEKMLLSPGVIMDSEATKALEEERDRVLGENYERGEVHFMNRLLKRAFDLRVHVPSFHGPGVRGVSTNYTVGPETDLLYLSEEGTSVVRKAIREEERWRMEKRAQWTPWIAALTGLVGATTGLLAVIL